MRVKETSICVRIDVCVLQLQRAGAPDNLLARKYVDGAFCNIHQARNGDFYSKKQFLAHYVILGETLWNEAAYYVIGSPSSSAEHGPSAEPLTGICGAAKPAEVLAPFQSPEDLAHDPAAPPQQPLRATMNYLLESSPAPEPTHGICGAAEPAEVDDGAGLVALHAIFTHDDFKIMVKLQTGGKAACQKQRELRTRLLATVDVREADLTASDFDWKAVLKSLPTGAHIVGTGIC